MPGTVTKDRQCVGAGAAACCPVGERGSERPDRERSCPCLHWTARAIVCFLESAVPRKPGWASSLSPQLRITL